MCYPWFYSIRCHGLPNLTLVVFSLVENLLVISDVFSVLNVGNTLVQLLFEPYPLFFLNVTQVSNNGIEYHCCQSEWNSSLCLSNMKVVINCLAKYIVLFLFISLEMFSWWTLNPFLQCFIVGRLLVSLSVDCFYRFYQIPSSQLLNIRCWCYATIQHVLVYQLNCILYTNRPEEVTQQCKFAYNLIPQ